MADSLSDRIRQARDDAGLTREQMFPMVGVSLRTLSRWESGETTRISLDNVARIAEVTGKPMSYFLVGAEVAA